jgi:hypothetical protein
MLHPEKDMDPIPTPISTANATGSTVGIHEFHQMQEYASFYPYYLPSSYSDYYPKNFGRYYEPDVKIAAAPLAAIAVPSANQHIIDRIVSNIKQSVQHHPLLAIALVIAVVLLYKKLIRSR